jgi:hypothetical protein
MLGLTQDPRYADLSWKQKQVVLQKFAEDNPAPYSSVAVELERLKHLSNDGTPQSKEFHSSLYDARRKWISDIRGGVDPSVASPTYESQAKVAADRYAQNLEQRGADIGKAIELNDAESLTGISVGNTLALAADLLNPANLGNLEPTDRANRVSDAEAKIVETIKYFKDKGYSDEEINTLRSDAVIATGATAGAPAGVDSQGFVQINDGALVLDIDNVRSFIDTLPAPENEREKAKASLEQRQKQLVDTTFEAVSFYGGLTWDGGANGTPRKNPKLRPLNSISTLVGNFFSEIGRKAGISGTDAEDRLTGSFEARDNDGLFSYNWSDEEKLAAVRDLVQSRDDVLDRARIGLSKGITTDIFNMVSTPLEILGNDTAKGLNIYLKEIDSSASVADRLADITGFEEFTELGSRILPQVILTRKVGNIGGAGAARLGALEATQARVATLFATGFGGMQSATFNSRDVLDNGGTTGEALTAGILGFGTTFALANGFSAIGAGGVEQFRSKATAASTVAKSQLRQRLTNLATQGLGEGVEEFVDEFINGMITQDHTGATAEQLASNAFKAALIGGSFGAGFGVAAPTKKTVTANSSNADVEAAADAAMEEMTDEQADQQDKDFARVAD